jgi:3-hydroxyisobutyrate dehydrogenase-like beta-hydroxyacid dehydrogenase
MSQSQNPGTRVALLGLGPMGAPIAANLLRGLGDLTVWNRTASKCAPLADLGATVADTPRAAAAPITLTVLPDLEQVESVLYGERGLIAGWADRAIESPTLVIHGTVSPVAVADLASDLYLEHRIRVLDAPLSGGTIGAEAGTLSVMVGGDAATAEQTLPLFQHIGATIRYLGGSGSGALAKACNQIVVAGTIAAVSESMLLARTAGLDLAVLQELLQGGLARCEVVAQKGAKWITENFDAGGSATNQLKDLRFIREAADAHAISLPTTRQVTRLFDRMVTDGDGALDHTGVYLTIRDGENRHDHARDH